MPALETASAGPVCVCAARLRAVLYRLQVLPSSGSHARARSRLALWACGSHLAMLGAENGRAGLVPLKPNFCAYVDLPRACVPSTTKWHEE